MSTETIASNTGFEAELNDWIAQEKAAIRLITIVGTLRFDRAIDLIIFRLPLHDASVSEVLAHHNYAYLEQL